MEIPPSGSRLCSKFLHLRSLSVQKGQIINFQFNYLSEKWCCLPPPLKMLGKQAKSSRQGFSIVMPDEALIKTNDFKFRV